MTGQVRAPGGKRIQWLRLEDHGYSLVGIKEWRTRELEAGRPSSLRDFYAAHGICAACGGTARM